VGADERKMDTLGGLRKQRNGRKATRIKRENEIIKKK
jgi:hypothetical protein